MGRVRMKTPERAQNPPTIFPPKEYFLIDPHEIDNRPKKVFGLRS